MTKEICKNITREIDAAENKKAADSKRLEALREEMEKTGAAIQKAMEDDDIKAYQNAVAQKEMIAYKLSKLSDSIQAGYITPETYMSMNNAMVQEYTSIHAETHRELLEIAKKIDIMLGELAAKREQVMNLNNRLNEIAQPKTIRMLGGEAPMLSALRDVKVLIGTLERNANI